MFADKTSLNPSLTTLILNPSLVLTLKLTLYIFLTFLIILSPSFIIIDPNYNGFSFTITKDILIARVTTSTSDITSLEASIAEGYPTLDEAIKASENAPTTTYIYVYGDCEISSDVTIGANVELYLPHSSAVTEWVNYNPETGSGNEHSLDVNNTQIQSTLTRYNLITINEDVTLTINGCLTIGADRGQNAGTSGSGSIEADTRSGYSEVILNGDIIVNGYIYCYGYIRGTGKIEAKLGSSIYEPFVITDWAGATKSGGVYGGSSSQRTENNRVPFSQFEVRHVEVETKINYGANLIGLAAIYTSKAHVIVDFDPQWNTTYYPLLGTKALLEPMDSDAYIVKKYDSNTNKTTILIYGNVQDNYGSLRVEVVPGIITLDMSTQNLFFPISYKMNIEIMNDSKLTLNQRYKMMPGSSFIIHQGAVVNLAGDLIVYKNYVDKNTGIPLYPSGKDEAYLLVEGTLNVTGGIAGVIKGNLNAKLDLSSAKNIELKSNEGIYTGGQTDLMGSCEMTVISSQHLFAYNTNAANVLVDWNVPKIGDTPFVLDNYKLSNNMYFYDGTKWVIGNYSINFETNGYEEIESISAYNNEIISSENLPFYNTNHYVEYNSSKYKFVGWYLDSQFQKPVEKYTITSDITLYAKYEITNAELVKVIFNAIGKTYTYLYDKGSIITLPTVSYDLIGTIYDNNNLKVSYYFVNNKEYVIRGYLNNEYEYGEEITINSDIILNLDYTEISKNLDYYEITIIKVQAVKGSSAQPKKTNELIIRAFKNVNLNISNVEGYNCSTSYTYTPGKDGSEIFGIQIGATYGTINMGTIQNVIITSSVQIYFDGGQA